VNKDLPDRLALGLIRPKMICRVTRRRNPTPELMLLSVVHVMDTPDVNSLLVNGPDVPDISKVLDEDASGVRPVKASSSKPRSQSTSRISTRMP